MTKKRLGLREWRPFKEFIQKMKVSVGQFFLRGWIFEWQKIMK